MEQGCFREHFRACRLEVGLTQQRLASELGVSIGTVACWELGRSPDLASAVKVADFFGVTLDWLVRGRGPKKSRSLARSA